MKDKGFPSGLIQDIETSQDKYKGFFGIRKMFWTYLKKLNVPFYDPCCTLARYSDVEPIGWDESLGQFVRYNGTAWVPVNAFQGSTTTTTTL